MGTDQPTNRPTDQPTNRPTDGRTKRGIESRSTRLKNEGKLFEFMLNTSSVLSVVQAADPVCNSTVGNCIRRLWRIVWDCKESYTEWVSIR